MTLPLRGFNLSQRRFQTLANLAFLTLFPGFVAYHYAIASNWMGPVVAGLFGPAAIVFSAIAAVQMATRFHSPAAQPFALEKAFLGLVIYLMLWSVAAYALVVDRSYALPAVKESLGTAAIWLTCYFIGCRASFESRRMQVVLFGASALILALFAHAMIVHSSVLGPFLAFKGVAEDADGEAAAATYQGIGRSILVLALLVALLRKRVWTQSLILLTGAALLLCLGSRSHFVACVIAASVVTALGLFRAGQRLGAAAMLVLLLGIGYVAAALFLETRASELLDLAQSDSWRERSDLHARAVQIIGESPLLGDFGYHHRPGPLAGYAHNALSAWVGYGGVAFLAYCAMLAWSLVLTGMKVMSPTADDRSWMVAFQVNLLAVLLAVVSEPIFASVLPALGWGLTVSALAKERRLRLTHRLAIRLVANQDAAARP